MKKSFSCVSDNLEDISQDMIKENDLKFPEVHVV